MNIISNIAKPLNKMQLRRLACFFNKHANDRETMNLTKAHGFLSAILSSPEIITLVMQFYNQICSDFQSLGKKSFTLLLWHNDDILTLEESAWEVLSFWCKGYLLGARLSSLWLQDEYGVAMLYPIGVLAGEVTLLNEKDTNGNVITDDLPYKEKYKAGILDYVIEIYHYWHSHQNDNTLSDASHKIKGTPGCNEKCHCGSGKKFKKCCGSPLKVMH